MWEEVFSPLALLTIPRLAGMSHVAEGLSGFRAWLAPHADSSFALSTFGVHAIELILVNVTPPSIGLHAAFFTPSIDTFLIE